MFKVLGIDWQHGTFVVQGFPPFENSVWKKQITDYVVMQFTGLKDKNGKEIYEGDVIEAPGYAVPKITGVVAYEINNCNFTFAALPGAVVIGNIYEHSHLLK